MARLGDLVGLLPREDEAHGRVSPKRGGHLDRAEVAIDREPAQNRQR